MRSRSQGAVRSGGFAGRAARVARVGAMRAPGASRGSGGLVQDGESGAEACGIETPPLRALGARVGATVEYSLPELRQNRVLALYEKVSPTPLAYPRRSGVPAKRPL